MVKILLANSQSSLVIGVDVKTSELEVLMESNPDRLAIIQGDVSDRSVNQRAVETAANRRGKLDSMILNAGILRPVGPAAETAVAEWKQLFDVNFFALVHAVGITCESTLSFGGVAHMTIQIQLGLPYLRITKGQVLMTSSGVSLQPFPAWIAYACSKAAMNCLCSCFPTEEHRVKFLCVTPGIVDSGMQAQVREERKWFVEVVGWKMILTVSLDESDMGAKQYEWLSSLHAKGELLRPEQPAGSFARLALEGIPTPLNGLVISWNDSSINGGT